MPNLFIIIFSLMMLALIIGFLIGWILRRSATRKKYAQRISDLSKEDQQLASKLHSDSSNLTTNENNLSYIKEKLAGVHEELSLYASRHIEVVKNIKDLHNDQNKIETKIKDIDTHLEQSEKDLGLLQSQKEELLTLKTTHFENEQNVNKKIKEIEELEQHIGILIDDRDKLTQKSQNIDKGILKIESEIKENSTKVESIEAEFDEKKVAVLKEIDRNKQKALNYQYAIKHVNEKLSCGETVTMDAIDKLISKNEETKIFENIIKKLFGKSAKYLKGVK